MTTRAFLGLGKIGAAMAEAALRRGEAVTVWNRTADKSPPLHALGALVARTPADAARAADVVHLALTDDAAVDGVLEGIDRPPGVVLDHTTTSPASTAARAARLASRGIAFLHAPVFMSPAACRDSKGVMLVAGPRALFDRVESALRPMTGRLEHVGERADLAAALKLFGNATILSLVGTLADVLAIGRSLGIPPEQARSVFDVFDPGGGLRIRGAAMARGDYRPSFDLATARKDIGLMLEAGGAIDLTVIPALARRMDELVARGVADADVGVMAVDVVPPIEGR
jgi:3-hydroxyisobutyrate dehydrogenase